MRAGIGRFVRLAGAPLAVTTLAVTTGLGLAAGPAGATTSCHAGTHAYKSGQARTFCGRATATVTIAGHKTAVKPGQCQLTAKGFTINLGTILLGVKSSTPPNYFGITLGAPAYPTPAAKDGTYTQGAVSFVIAHKSYTILSPTVTLTGHRSHGTFSGKLLTGGTASGTFSCG